MHLPSPSDNDFELPPAGTHMAVCYRVIDLGTQQVEWQGQTKQQHKVLLSWELTDEKMSDERAFTISQRYTLSMSDKATLRKHLEAWRGKAFTDADFGPKGFNIKNLLGVGCLLTVTHAEKNGKHYANISGIGKLMKGMNTPETTNEKVYLGLSHETWDADTFHKLTQNLQGTIMKSPEYGKLVNGYDEAPPVDAQDQMNDEIPF